MDKKELAVDCFKRGYSCSQAVFSTFSQELGMEPEMALKTAGAFGGGMARMGETCGAVTGAFMALGLKHGKAHEGDDAAREKTYGLVHEFVTRFQASHGSIRCNTLLDCDMSTPEGRKQARDQKKFDELCPLLVHDAAEILEEIL